MRRVVVAYLEVSKGGENTRFYVRRTTLVRVEEKYESFNNETENNLKKLAFNVNCCLRVC